MMIKSVSGADVLSSSSVKETRLPLLLPIYTNYQTKQVEVLVIQGAEEEILLTSNPF